MTIVVPKRVREIIGSSRLRQDLKTCNFAIASVAKIEPYKRMRAQIDAALAMIGEGNRARDMAAYRNIIDNFRITPELYDRTAIAEIEASLEIPVEERVGLAPLPTAPTETDLVELHGRYLAEQGERLCEKTLIDDRVALKWLLRWFARERVSASLENLTERRVGQFADVLPDLASFGRSTSGKLLSRLSSFGRWTVRRGMADTNPWIEHARKMRLPPSPQV